MSLASEALIARVKINIKSNDPCLKNILLAKNISNIILGINQRVNPTVTKLVEYLEYAKNFLKFTIVFLPF